MPNYTANIGLFVGERQSPICTDYSVTLVLACSATLVGWISDAKHGTVSTVLYSGRLPVEQGRHIYHPPTIVGRERRWVDFPNKKGKGVASGGANSW